MAFVPVGEDLASGTVESVDLPTDPNVEATEITFVSGVELTEGETYAIVCNCPTATYTDEETNNCPTWGQVIVDGYADGRRCANLEGDTQYGWSTHASRDCYFVTKATGVVKDSFTDQTHIVFLQNADWWIAQTFKASSTYTITSVVLALGKSLYATDPGTINVTIRATVDVPIKAATPTPSDAAVNVTLDQATITWEDGGDANKYDVWYGDTSGDLTKVSSAQVGLSFTVTGITLGSPYNYLVTRYWRIDSINEAGTTTGDEWSFTTMRFDPPKVTYWYSTGNYYYQLLVQSDGTYGDPPPTGVENTDYVILAAGYVPNFVRTVRKLVGAANSKIWYEDV
jgi:hypothetical protein